MEDVGVFFTVYVSISAFGLVLLFCFFRCPEVLPEEKLRVALKATAVVAVSCILIRTSDLVGVDREWDLLVTLVAMAFAVIGFVAVTWNAVGRGADELLFLLENVLLSFVGFDKPTTKPTGAGKFPASAE